MVYKSTIAQSGGGGGSPSIGGTITGGTDTAVLFVHPSSTLAQDVNNLSFVDAASGTASYTQFSTGTNGDLGGTDAINIYNQGDAFLPNSIINGGSGQAANLLLDGLIPGWTASSARGTGASPVILNTADYVGAFSAWGYTGSSPAYVPMATILGVARGSTSNNLGGELQLWTKADNGNLTQQATLANNGFFGLTGTTAPASQLHTAGNFSAPVWTTNGIAIRQDAGTYTDTTTAASGTVVTASINSLLGGAIASTNATVTYTAAATLYITAPTAGTNVTLTNAYALITGRTLVASNTSSAFRVLAAVGGNAAFDVDAINTRVCIGNTVPSAQLHVVAVNQTLASWTTNGIGLRWDSATYTDSTSSGTVAAEHVHVMNGPTIAASSATTFTDSATLYIPSGPTGGTNTTITSSWAALLGRTGIANNTSSALRITTAVGATASFNFNSTSSQFTIGTNGITAQLGVTGNQTAAAWTTNGIGIRWQTATYTDSSSSGTVSTNAIHAFAQPTIASSSATTYTNAATLYIAAGPTNGANVTISNVWSMYIAAGAAFFGGGINLSARNIVTDTTTGTIIGTATTQKLGFFNATPVVQQATTGTATGFTAGAGTAVKDDSTFTGASGSTAYRISDIVLALKNLGILAA